MVVFDADDRLVEQPEMFDDHVPASLKDQAQTNGIEPNGDVVSGADELKVARMRPEGRRGPTAPSAD